MKILSTLILIFAISTFALAQNSFNYETDVHIFFEINRSFRNKSNSVTLDFPDMGTYLKVGNSTYFEPEITIINSTKKSHRSLSKHKFKWLYKTNC